MMRPADRIENRNPGAPRRNRARALVVLTLAIAGSLASARMAAAAKLTCLVGTDPVVAGDAAAIAAARAAIESACPCASYDGSAGDNHSSYIACAADRLRDIVMAGDLRRQCAATVKTFIADSTCGFPPHPRKEVCVKTILLSGRVSCAIKSATKKDGTPDPQCFTKPMKFNQVACEGHTHCIDAADTNGDLDIDAPGDSGGCNPAPTPTPTPVPTPNGSPSPLPTGSAGATLAELVNEYRTDNLRPAIPLSPALEQTAAAHVADLMAHPEIVMPPCTAFSWSNNGGGLWNGCCFTPGQAQVECMWSKPEEISTGLAFIPYPGKGYELIGFAHPMTPQRALDLFTQAPSYNAVILNLPPWGSFAPWPALGAAISGDYASVWFGDATDPQPQPTPTPEP